MTVDDWDDPVAAKPGEWNGVRYDSLLELAWFKTLTAYGFDWQPHPGRVELDGGTYWEPDLMVSGMLAEIKPWSGESVERLWKPYRAAELHRLPVLILRPGYVAPGWDVEQAGCDWSCTDSMRWVVDLSEERPAFKYDLDVEPENLRGVRDAASLVVWNPELNGLPMLHHSHNTGDEPHDTSAT